MWRSIKKIKTTSNLATRHIINAYLVIFLPTFFSYMIIYIYKCTYLKIKLGTYSIYVQVHIHTYLIIHSNA